MEFVIAVPAAVPELTVKTKVKVALVLAFMEELEQETVVPLSVQVQPVGTVSEEKVTSVGTLVKESTAVTDVAVAGPLLVTTAV